MGRPYGMVLWLLAGCFLGLQLVGAAPKEDRLEKIRKAKSVEELSSLRDSLRATDEASPLADREVRRAWRDKRRELVRDEREQRRAAHETSAPGTR